MANGKGFADINPYANAAGIVLPDSQTADFAIDQIQRQGVIAQKQQQANLAYKAQVNKDFATNKLDIPPTVTYKSELAGLSQKWFDKGIQYRKQNFDPFNPDYNKPDQVEASQQYLAEKRQIEEMAGTAKEVDKAYNENKKAVQEGKLDGWDDFNNALKGQTLQQLYKKGGVESLPMLYKPYSQKAVDEDTKIKPMVRTYDVQVPGMPGVVEKHEEKYVDMKQAKNTAETTMLAQGSAFAKKLQKDGIGDPNSLYTKGGHYITYDNPNDPEDPGHIDQPAIFHQMVVDNLTKPELIKNLPASVKQRILDSHEPGMPLTDGTKLTASGKIVKPYDVSNDADFVNHVHGLFTDQLKKEADYQSLIYNTVQRNLPADLGDKTKTDATMARLNLAQKANYISQAHLKLDQDREKRIAAKQASTGNANSLIEQTRTGADKASAWHTLSATLEGNPNYQKGLTVKESPSDKNIVDVTIPGKLIKNPDYDPNWEANYGSKSKEDQDLNKARKNQFIRSDATHFRLDRSKPAEYHAKLLSLKKIAGGDKEMNTEGKMLEGAAPLDSAGDGEDNADDF